MYWVLGLALALVAAVFITGAILPREHVAERQQVIHAAPDVVFAKLADLNGRTAWVPGLQRVTIEPGGRFYTEVHEMGPLRMELMEQTPPRRLLTRIADDKLEFGGTWTITVIPHSSGASVTVREDGFVKSPLFRFVSRFIFGHTRTVDRFLAGLAAQYPG